MLKVLSKNLLKPPSERIPYPVTPRDLKLICRFDGINWDKAIDDFFEQYDMNDFMEHYIDTGLKENLSPEEFQQYAKQRKAVQPGWTASPLELKSKAQKRYEQLMANASEPPTIGEQWDALRTPYKWTPEQLANLTQVLQHVDPEYAKSLESEDIQNNSGKRSSRAHSSIRHEQSKQPLQEKQNLAAEAKPAPTVIYITFGPTSQNDRDTFLDAAYTSIQASAKAKLEQKSDSTARKLLDILDEVMSDDSDELDYQMPELREHRRVWESCKQTFSRENIPRTGMCKYCSALLDEALGRK